jgi:hypothetical protein
MTILRVAVAGDWNALDRSGAAWRPSSAFSSAESTGHVCPPGVVTLTANAAASG